MQRLVWRTCMLILWAKGYLEVIVLLNRSCGDQHVESVC